MFRSHPFYDEFWSLQNIHERIETIKWPVVMLAGWFDLFTQSNLDFYQGIRENGSADASDSVYLVIGPYTHTTFNTLENGEFVFPENAYLPYGRTLASRIKLDQSLAVWGKRYLLNLPVCCITSWGIWIIPMRPEWNGAPPLIGPFHPHLLNGISHPMV